MIEHIDTSYGFAEKDWLPTAANSNYGGACNIVNNKINELVDTVNTLDTYLNELTDKVQQLADNTLKLSLQNKLTDSHRDIVRVKNTIGKDDTITMEMTCGAASQYIEDLQNQKEVLKYKLDLAIKALTELSKVDSDCAEYAIKMLAEIKGIE